MYHIYIDGVHLYLTVKHIILHRIAHLQIHVTREGSSGFLPKTFGKPSCQVFCENQIGAVSKARPENCEEPIVKAGDHCAAVRRYNTESKLGW
jgi:hypothetical protein